MIRVEESGSWAGARLPSTHLCSRTAYRERARGCWERALFVVLGAGDETEDEVRALAERFQALLESETPSSRAAMMARSILLGLAVAPAALAAPIALSRWYDFFGERIAFVPTAIAISVVLALLVRTLRRWPSS